MRWSLGTSLALRNDQSPLPPSKRTKSMLFQTPEFVALLLAVFAALAVLKSPRPQQAMLLGASYLFYGWWDVRFLMLLLVSTVVDYSVARRMNGAVSWQKRWQLSFWLAAGAVAFLVLPPASNTELRRLAAWIVAGASALPLVIAAVDLIPERSQRRVLLGVSLVTNLGMLGYFKYRDFFAQNYNGLSGWFGWESSIAPLELALPVGISFYTFQTLSYTIDVYRGDLQSERSFRRLALYVSYFPQLVAGPIIRPQTFLPTLAKPWTLSESRFVSGFHLAVVGLVKKVVIADSIAPLVAVVLDEPAAATTLSIWMASVLFTVQIYCDFSGYTDIARGVSRMLGVEIPLNFDAPLLATSMADFWRRWHISFSTWLRDYLFLPICGRKPPETRVAGAMMATMLIGGLWHGAGWNYVVWGGYQGVCLCVNRWFGRYLRSHRGLKSRLQTPAGTLVRWAATMYFTALGMLIFRVHSLEAVLVAIRKFIIFDGELGATGAGLGRGAPFQALLMASLFFLCHFGGRLRGSTWADRLDLIPHRLQPAFGVFLGAGLFFTWPTAESPFVYFQF